MKNHTKILFLLPVLIAGVNLIPAGWATAQTFTVLHTFTGTGGDGMPVAELTLSGNVLYGTTYGTVFAVNTDGTGFTNLYGFTALSGPNYTNSDGFIPAAGLILSGDTLYGTAIAGGEAGKGTVFAVHTNGTGFTNLHSFTATPYSTNSDGVDPLGGLVLSGNTLYGTAASGGSSGLGTVFALNTDGSGFTNMHSFTGSDGAWPHGGLVLSGNTLYGTTSLGGTVFAVNTDGTGFTNLHNFNYSSDGAQPNTRLVLSGNTLYGTTEQGGGSGHGTVFAVNTDGTGFTTLHRFTDGSDGAAPDGTLILSGNTLYGTAVGGGSSGRGTVFAVNTDGTGFMTLHSFTAGANNGNGVYTNSDGANPYAGLVLSGNTLYGTASGGGSGPGAGTVFSITLPAPQLTITPSGTNVILSWPTNVAGFDYTSYTLQSTTNLGSPVWSTNSPAPVVIAGQNVVTNPIIGARKFYRLAQ